MRGDEEQQNEMYSYRTSEMRVPQDHPLRALRQMCDVALRPDDDVWHPTVFTKNRDRLLAGEIAQRFLEAVLQQAAAQQLLSDEHFTVDGTLIQAWASRRSFQPKDPPPIKGTGARGRKWLRDLHESKTDPEARLYKKSRSAEACPSYLGHVLMENRSGLVVAACATQSSATAERAAALRLLDARGRSPQAGNPTTTTITLGADKHYQEEKFISELRRRQVVPHVAEYRDNDKWRNWLTEEERQDPGFAISQQKRKLVERIFGWAKLDSILRQVKLRGQQKVDWFFRLLASAANLVRMVKLIPAV